MAKRKTPEAVIVQFFMSAPPDAAYTLLTVAQSLVAARGITGPALPAATGPRAGRRNGKRPTLDVTHLQPAQDATTAN